MLTKESDGWKFWKEILRAPRYIVAPMVNASELAWRMLSRKYGAELCYTPMLHSSVFIRDPKYRKESLVSCAGDRPLIVQFCGNDPKILLEAALLAEDHCDAIDINLGCPQTIAKKGHYGAFLQDDWDLLQKIVSTLHKALKVPVTCKVRIFESLEKTIAYAKMLESAGCQMLTVHGRTREQKGLFTGLADWNYVKEIRQILKIPVISNGNIQFIQDVHRCLEETGVVGIMAAEGNLHNPALFAGLSPLVWDIGLEYLELVEKYPCPSSYVRGHLFKLFHHLLSLQDNFDLRIKLGQVNTIDDFRDVTNSLKDKYLDYHEGYKICNENFIEKDTCNLVLPPWLCQPYVRAPPDEHKKKLQTKMEEAEQNTQKRVYEDEDGNQISYKKMKKLRRISRRPPKDLSTQVQRSDEKCANCQNTPGCKCDYKLCKKCCKTKCFKEELDCKGHKILIKTRRDRARQFTLIEEPSLIEQIDVKER